MGFFDFLKGKSNPPPGVTAPPGDKKVVGLAKTAADKRAQTYDRLEALQALADMKTPEAAAALLPRFKFSIDPSITDQDEKDLAFAGIVAAGKGAVPHVLEYCENAEGRGWPLTWPVKLLHELLDEDAYREELIDLLASYDTEYARNVDPKLQVLLGLQELVHEDVRLAVEPFLEDQNETIRFHAVETTFHQNDDKSLPVLLKRLAAEESVRIKNKMADGLVFRGWVVPEGERADLKRALLDTSGYDVGDDGKVVKTARYD